jgi:hypothetical protein
MPGSINVDARIAVVGTEGIAQSAGPLVTQVVFALVERSEPFSALEEDNAQSGFGEFFCDHAASCAATDDHRVDMFQGHQPDRGLERSERTLPRIGGYGRFSIFQLTPSRLLPCRGSP